jgi:hypothetical protein
LGKFRFSLCVLSILVAKAAALEKRELQMGMRGFLLAAGAAALLSSQAVYAAPRASGPIGFDPLVSLSLLGSVQSSAAVCGAAAGATAAADAAAAQAAPPAGCVLPVTEPPAPAPMGEAVAPVAPVGTAGIGMLPLLLGLAAIIGVIALVASGSNHGHGDVTPVSPA